MSITAKFFLLLVLMIAFAGIVKADPIRIISGTVTPNSFDLQGNNSSFKGELANSAGREEQRIAPGTTTYLVYDLFRKEGLITFPTAVSFLAQTTVNGTTYPLVTFGFPQRSSMIFTSVIPVTFPNNVLNGFSVQVPFTMQGTLNANYNGEVENNPAYSVKVFGQGYANYTFYSPGFTNQFALSTVNFTFTSTSTPEPTPEPATILLLGTGLAGIFGYARRKRRLKQSE
jgi:hypothetical protein